MVQGTTGARIHLVEPGKDLLHAAGPFDRGFRALHTGSHHWGAVICTSVVTFCQSGSSYILSFVVKGAVTSLEASGPTAAVKENLPTGSSSDLLVRAQTVTLPARPERSASE